MKKGGARQNMRILAVGDIVGERAVSDLRACISEITKKYSPEIIIANGENAAGGRGLVPSLASDIFAAGADVITTGNHILDRRAILPYLDSTDRVLRPANLPPETPGVGYCIFSASGIRVLVLNISGTVYMKSEELSPAFETAECILSREACAYDFAVIDIHAEATGEKLAFARYFDTHRECRVAAVWGTHTHIPTSDVRILPGGTGYVTDLGMTGPQDGILGIRSELIINFTKNHLPTKFEVADGATILEGVLFDIDPDAARAKSVRRVKAGG